MLANPRSLGYNFNPISVFWCHDSSGRLAGTILEVHYPTGDRHAYLVQTDEHGKAEVDKAMYVSPFHDVSGRDQMTSAPVPGDTAAVSITLQHYVWTGVHRALTGRTLRSRGARRCGPPSPHSSVRHASASRASGSGCARLPVRPRPHHTRQEGVQ